MSRQNPAEVDSSSAGTCRDSHVRVLHTDERASTKSSRTSKSPRTGRRRQSRSVSSSNAGIGDEHSIICWNGGEKQTGKTTTTPSTMRGTRLGKPYNDDVICLTDDDLKPPALLACPEDDIYVGDTLENMTRFEKTALDMVGDKVSNDVTYIETRQPDLVCLGSQPALHGAIRSPAARVMLRNDRALAEELEDAEAAGQLPMRKRFKSSLIEKCSICLEENVAVWRGISLNNCQHEFCIECFAGFVKSKRGGQDVICPNTNCDTTVALSDIRYSLIENGDSKAWSTFQEQATLSFMEQKVAGDVSSNDEASGQSRNKSSVGHGTGNVQNDRTDDSSSVYRRCPANHCNYIFEYTSNGSGCDFQCPVPSCRTGFCLDCGANGGQVGPSHPGQTCSDRLDQIRQEEEERQKLDSWKRENAQADTRFRALVQNERSRGMSRTCPKCHELVTKNGGCDHMKCRCGHHFNWSQAK